jgi:hypothetical protein
MGLTEKQRKARKRENYQIDCRHERDENGNIVMLDGKPKLLKAADQSYKKSVDINNILKEYAKIGRTPEAQFTQEHFVDNTLAVPLEEAFNIVQKAYDSFYELPSIIRKQMNNDPSKLEAYLAEKENRDLLEKHGIFKKKKEPNVKAQSLPTEEPATPSGDKNTPPKE